MEFDKMINQVIQGDCLSILKTMPNESIDCCITSPPYWGLRAYGTNPQIWDGDSNCQHEWGKEISGAGKNNDQTAGEIQRGNKGSIGRDSRPGSCYCSKCSAWRGELGLEPTFNLYIKHLIQVFNEVKRVLKKTGTCFVNIGDTYYGGGGGNQYSPENKGILSKAFKKNPDYEKAGGFDYGYRKKQKECLDKSLCQIPSRFAIAMSDNGWILRNEIIWYKRNCMPSSIKDRFTVDFEPVFFLTKSNETQFWTNEKTLQLVTKQPAGINGIEGQDWEYKEVNGKTKKTSFWSGHDYYFDQQFEKQKERPRPKRVSEKSFGGNGQATSPVSGLGTRMIYPNPQGRNTRTVWDITTQPFKEAHFATFPPELPRRCIKAGCPKEGVVLDPFSGAGTTPMVAKELGRNYIGIELSEKYIKMARKRIEETHCQPELIGEV